MPFSAHITDVIIKAGGAQNTLGLDWHKTPHHFFGWILPVWVFFSFNPEDLSAFWHDLESPDSEELSVLPLKIKMASWKNRWIVAAPLVGDAQQLDGIRPQSE